MKKGLVVFLIISISALLATLALTFIFYNIDIISHNHTPVSSVDSTKEPVISATPTPVATGTPEEVAQVPESKTGEFLKKKLNIK